MSQLSGRTRQNTMSKCVGAQYDELQQYKDICPARQAHSRQCPAGHIGKSWRRFVYYFVSFQCYQDLQHLQHHLGRRQVLPAGDLTLQGAADSLNN